MPSSLPQYEQPSPWEQHFYSGDRLQAEITLLGAGLNGSLANKEVVSGLRLIHTSFGSRLPTLINLLVSFPISLSSRSFLFKGCC